MDDVDFLDTVLKADKYGWISKPKSKTKAVVTSLLDDFNEINDFYREFKRAPQEGGDMIEFKLAIKLEKIQSDISQVNDLKDYDEFNLLEEQSDILNDEPVEKEEINSLEDVLNSSFFNSISPSENSASNIFNIKNVTDPEIIKERKKAVEIGKTIACDNFHVFEPLFKNVQHELSKSTKILGAIAATELSVSEFKVGNFYLLKGMLLYIDYMSEVFRGTDRDDCRLVIIFENGTQSTMLLRSLTKRIREDVGAKRILNIDASVFNAKRVRAQDELDFDQYVIKENKANGYIYIAKTLKPDLKNSYKHLYKIGLTKRDVTERFKEAPKDPAFLMYEAEQVKIIPLHGLNLNSVEGAIHSLFGSCRLDIDVTGVDGKNHKPKEWFNVPIEAINDAVTLIEKQTIHLYRYDNKLQQLVRR